MSAIYSEALPVISFSRVLSLPAVAGEPFRSLHGIRSLLHDSCNRRHLVPSLATIRSRHWLKTNSLWSQSGFAAASVASACPRSPGCGLCVAYARAAGGRGEVGYGLIASVPGLGCATLACLPSRGFVASACLGRRSQPGRSFTPS
jgi:hypothetical protein